MLSFWYNNLPCYFSRSLHDFDDQSEVFEALMAFDGVFLSRFLGPYLSPLPPTPLPSLPVHLDSLFVFWPTSSIFRSPFFRLPSGDGKGKREEDRREEHSFEK